VVREKNNRGETRLQQIKQDRQGFGIIEGYQGGRTRKHSTLHLYPSDVIDDGHRDMKKERQKYDAKNRNSTE